MVGEPLRPDRPLRFEAQRCLAWQQRTGCRACRDACPVDALLWSGNSLALHPDCLGCGRCLPVCPMGALTLAGFATEIEPPEVEPLDDAQGSNLGAAQQLRLECHRVPDALRQGAKTVPCCAAIDEALLIAWVAQHEAGVVWIDRGWCATCPAGGSQSPIAPLMQQAEAVWDAFALPPDRRPRIDACPVPAAVAEPLPARHHAAQPFSRRAFFRQLIAPPAPPTPVPANCSPSISRPAAHPSLAKTRRDQALRLLSEALGKQPELPGPMIVASDSCRNHQGCAAICPTGAISRWEEGLESGITWDANRCIGCRLCVEHCPEKALQLVWQKQPVAARTAAHRLTRHQLLRCRRCGAAFAGNSCREDDKEVLCPECEKEKALARELFGGLFASVS